MMSNTGPSSARRSGQRTRGRATGRRAVRQPRTHEAGVDRAMKSWVRWAILAAPSVGARGPVPRSPALRTTTPTASRPTPSVADHATVIPVDVSDRQPTPSPSPQPERTIIEVTYRDGAVRGPDRRSPRPKGTGSGSSCTPTCRTRSTSTATTCHADVDARRARQDRLRRGRGRACSRWSSKAPASRCSSWRSFPDPAGSDPRRHPGDVAPRHRRPRLSHSGDRWPEGAIFRSRSGSSSSVPPPR